MAGGAVIVSAQNARVKALRSGFGGNLRLSGGLVGIEGETLLAEAVRSGAPVDSVFLRQGTGRPAWLPASVKAFELAANVFAAAVETQSPQGIAALVRPRRWTLAQTLTQTLTQVPALLLIAAGLQDPGNLGTLVRSAEAFGATGVLTAAGTVSAWNAKAVRASAGSVFRMALASVTVEAVEELRRREIRVLAAVVEDGAGVLPAEHAGLHRPCALVIGNEGAGLDESWQRAADALVRIPLPGPVESLNAAVAGSVLLYEAARQRAASEGR